MQWSVIASNFGRRSRSIAVRDSNEVSIRRYGVCSGGSSSIGMSGSVSHSNGMIIESALRPCTSREVENVAWSRDAAETSW